MKVLKSFAILCLGALLVGCNPDNGGKNNEGLVLHADKNYIYNNGGATPDGVLTFTVTYNGQVLNGGYEIYEDDVNLLEGNTFTSEVIKTYRFYAIYGAEQSNELRINVMKTPPPAPAVPVDANPSKLNFARRVLLLQFTGTGCQYCPGMVNALIDMNEATHYETQEYLYKDQIAIAAAHIGSYAGSDPALLEDAPTLDDAFGIVSYPSLIIDMVPGNVNPSYAAVSAATDKALARTTAKAGIAVNAAYHAEDMFVVINTLVKASQTEEFRIGAWLLEDGIVGAQSMNAAIEKKEGVNYNIHNNCIRRANSKQGIKDFTGLNLGTIKSGETKSMEFSFPLKANWKSENLHLLVFVSTKDEKGKWYVNNVVKAPINGTTDFVYAE